MVKVVFLCGGIGKRMHPVTKDKFLLNFLGKTLLERQINLAQEAGFDNFVIISNPNSFSKIKEICNKVKSKTEIIIQEEPKGMADALLSAKESLIEDDIIVVKTNDVFDISAYKKIMNEYKNSDYDSYLLGYEVEKYFPGGYLSVNENDEIDKIVEKPGKGNEPSNMINIVVHLHKDPKRLLEYLEKTERRRDDVYEFSMYKMMKDGLKFKAVRYNGFWAAIPYPWSIFKVMNHFLGEIKEKKISPEANIDESAKIKGKVIIEGGVRVFENAVIKGPCYIGKESVIGNNALVRNSHISKKSVVGFSSEIKDSYIGKNCWFHNNYIGDSIISDRCSFGSGSVTGNLRFDEKDIEVETPNGKKDSGTNKLGVIMGEDCRTGINASIMPGVKVGPNSIVGPGVVLYENLGENKLAFVPKEEYNIKQNSFDLDIGKREKEKKNLNK